MFKQAAGVFQEVDSVSGKISGEDGVGLGPTFNGNSCAQCHAQPAVGGSSPGLKSPQQSTPNPQVALATLHGANNKVPSFITLDGPVREARFISGPNGPDGGVHGLFTIAGRSDAPGCNLAQPDFATQVSNHNVVFRIPTPTFGLGFAENTPDAALQANLAANQALKNTLGIGGRLNTTGNDGSVTRFGWKAQNKSLLIFAGEAYNVEQGVSNEAFPNERSAVQGCVYNSTPEDATNVGTILSSFGLVSKTSSDLVNFAIFMRLSAPPASSTDSLSEKNGSAQFNNIGCALCHTPSLTTGLSPYTGMSNQTYHPFSDFAVHHMGSNLSDGVSQGSAGPDEFRTAPLWGLGQRLFFLHDGRTSDLMEAIHAHASSGSEANAVITKFDGLTASQKQDILNFLRSL
ncbi:MAG: thiol oxidoreductase [Acidobacteriia bacterium]|nr:thiol oxidoreductase [Terriglobia bacterium]